MKLSPRQVNAFASAICGAGDTPIDYRTGAQIDSFIAFVGVDLEWEPGRSRFYEAQAFVEACNATPAGRSGLPAGIEAVLVALADRREFDTDDAHLEGVEHLRGLLARLPVRLEVDRRRHVELLSTVSSRGQEIIEREIHTAFDQVLDDRALDAAREHLRKARRLLGAAERDYANATKEAVCVVESLAAALTGERDLNRAVSKSVRAGIVPAPLGEMIKKLYAYRGDEPGVAHADATVPDVDADDATFAVNVAAVISARVRVSGLGVCDVWRLELSAEQWPWLVDELEELRGPLEEALQHARARQAVDHSEALADEVCAREYDLRLVRAMRSQPGRGRSSTPRKSRRSALTRQRTRYRCGSSPEPGTPRFSGSCAQRSNARESPAGTRVPAGRRAAS